MNQKSASPASSIGKLMLGLAFVLGGVILAKRIGTPAQLAVYVGLSVWGLRGCRQAVQSMCLLVIVTLLNPAFSDQGGVGEEVAIGSRIGNLRWVVFLACSMRIWLDIFKAGHFPKEFRAVVLFLVCVLFLAVNFSRVPLLSVVKGLTFFVGVGAALAGTLLSGTRASDWTRWWFSIFFVVVLFSLPTLLMREVGFLKNDRGFQGILAHPQSYGTFLSPLVAYFTVLIVIDGAFRSAPAYAALAIGSGSLLMTQSRTAAFSTVLGVGAAILLRVIKRSARRRLGVPAMFAIAASIFAAVAVFGFSSRSGDLVKSFVTKHEVVADSGNLFASRENLLERSYYNFLAVPWTGIGFGVPSDLDSIDGLVGGSLLGVPLEAPSEKGLFVTALLEETGVVGTALFLLILMMLGWVMWRSNSGPALALLAACIANNLGEMVFFSFGGLGLHIWLLIGFALLQAKVAAPAPVAARPRPQMALARQ